jgi:hypothetical protein
MAAPYVSGLAAILFGYENNASLVREHLKQSALDIAPIGFDIYTGAGLIQMDAALRLITPTPTAVVPTGTAAMISDQGHVFVPPAFSTPVLIGTYTPVTTISAVPVSSVTSSPVITPTSTTVVQSNTPGVSLATATGSTSDVQALGDSYNFSSPLFCGGIIFILVGVFILFSIRKKDSRHL